MFLGKELAQGHNYSDAVAEKIDAEIGDLLRKAQQTARSVIQAHREKLTRLAKTLLVQETVEGPELRDLLTGSGESLSLAA